MRYPDISLHAVCRDTDAYTAPCIYCQLVPLLNAAEDLEGDAARCAVDELRLVPPPASAGTTDAVESIFAALTAGADLHPDDDGSETGGDGDGDSAMGSMLMDGSGGAAAWERLFASATGGAAPAAAGSNGEFDDALEEDEGGGDGPVTK